MKKQWKYSRKKIAIEIRETRENREEKYGNWEMIIHDLLATKQPKVEKCEHQFRKMGNQLFCEVCAIEYDREKHEYVDHWASPQLKDIEPISKNLEGYNYTSDFVIEKINEIINLLNKQ